MEATRTGSTITFRSPDALGHILRAPGELGLGRAYVTGEVDVDDLDGVIALLGRWQAPSLGPIAKLRLGTAALRAMGLRRLPHPPAAELRPHGSRHSKRRDSEAVRHHYDVSNEFFALFLDESMTYSCALFEEGTETLEEAQTAKLELICQKLELEAGQRVLDIGCGWGSLVIHAAREHGVSALGITLSPPQAELATERAREAGVGDQVEIRVADYRDLADDSFDAVASIGMVEHVGESQADEYGRQIERVLKRDGRVLNHGIVRVPAEKHGVHIGGEFSNRYVFPDGELLEPLPDARLFGASRVRDPPRREPPHRLRRDPSPLDPAPRSEPRTSGAASGDRAAAGLAPLSTRRPKRLRGRQHLRLPDALLAAANPAALSDADRRQAPGGAAARPRLIKIRISE